MRDVTLVDSNEQGLFLRIALLFWVLAVIGILYSEILSLAAGVLALVSTGAMISSTWDNNGGCSKPKCPLPYRNYGPVLASMMGAIST